MSFGCIMELPVDSLRIRLAPLTRESMGEFVRSGGMQHHGVTRYMGRRFAPTLEDEDEWYDNARQDQNRILWGIWDATESGSPVLLGSTGLNGIEYEPFKQAVSGVVIFRTDYWRKGIASRIHRARTWYAFHQLGLYRIKSAVIIGNDASYRALWNAGYETVGVERNTQFVDGKYRHQRNLECLNPNDPFWSHWWGDDTPNPETLEARERTLQAMEWAQQHVKLP